MNTTLSVKSSWPVSVGGQEATEMLSGAASDDLIGKCVKVHHEPFEFDADTMVEVESCFQGSIL
jgi:hypothetical protein